jgi:hypothetical protein
MEGTNLFVNGREMTMYDFITECDDTQYNQQGNNRDQSKRYRKQVEYGEKKYIKP